MSDPSTPTPAAAATPRNADRLIPAGVYRAKAIRAGFTESDEGGKLSVCVELTTHNGHAVTWFGSCSLSTATPSGQSAWDAVTEPTLRVLGWQGDPRRMELDRGRTVNIEIEHETYDGRTRARVRAIWPSAIDDRAARPATIEDFASLIGR